MTTNLSPGQRELFQNTAQIDRLLQKARVMALVGLSAHPEKPSHRVAVYLQKAGYRIVPVNPRVTSILGEPSYPDVSSIPFPIDLVDLFRPSSEISPFVDQAIERRRQGIDSPAVWMQLDIVALAAAERAHAAGLAVVIDRCTKIEHARLFQPSGDGSS